MIVGSRSRCVNFFAFVGACSRIYENFLCLLVFLHFSTFWLLLRVFVLVFMIVIRVWVRCEKRRFFIRNDNFFGLITLIGNLVFGLQALIRLINLRDLGRFICWPINKNFLLLMIYLIRLPLFLDSFSFQLHIAFLHKLFIK